MLVIYLGISMNPSTIIPMVKNKNPSTPEQKMMQDSLMEKEECSMQMIVCTMGTGLMGRDMGSDR